MGEHPHGISVLNPLTQTQTRQGGEEATIMDLLAFWNEGTLSAFPPLDPLSKVLKLNCRLNSNDPSRLCDCTGKVRLG